MCPQLTEQNSQEESKKQLKLSSGPRYSKKSQKEITHFSTHQDGRDLKKQQHAVLAQMWEHRHPCMLALYIYAIELLENHVEMPFVQRS